MSAPRKVTVKGQIKFEDMAMESTDAAIDIIKGVMITFGQHCRDEIKQALEDAGAKNVSVGELMAY